MYGMEVLSCYDDGSILDKQVLQINPDSLISKFENGVRNITALSLQAGLPTQVSIPHMVVNAFKNLAAIGLQVNYKFAQISGTATAAPAAPAAAAPAAKPAASTPAPAPEKPKDEPKPEEEDFDMGDMFG
jgi:large subunit ribosomal protein LP0